MINLKAIKYIIALSTFLSASIAHSDPLFNIKKECEFSYHRIQSLKDFLYKFDGNLTPIGEDKIKYIKRKKITWQDRKLPENVRSSAFKDIFYDPDNIQWTIQSEAKDLIKAINNFESLENTSGKDEINFNYLIQLDKTKKVELRAAYQRLAKALEIINGTYVFISNLEEAVQRAETIQREDIFARALPLSDRVQYGFELAFFRGSASDLLGCWINQLVVSTWR